MLDFVLFVVVLIVVLYLLPLLLDIALPVSEEELRRAEAEWRRRRKP